MTSFLIPLRIVIEERRSEDLDRVDVPAKLNCWDFTLAAGDNEASVCLTLQDLVAQMGRGTWDIILLAATFPKTVAESFEAFQLILRSLANVPVLLACRQSEMLDLPKFLNHGLRFYLVRDEGGDFIFLTLSSLESAVEACRADESRKLAERLREEMDGVRRLQESIIPQGLKPPAGYSITARYEPSQVTVVGQQPVVMAGGDYYDIFRPDDRTLVVLIGDASGHGLKACMSIMTMHTLVRMFRGDRYHPRYCRLCERNQRTAVRKLHRAARWRLHNAVLHGHRHDRPHNALDIGRPSAAADPEPGKQ